MVGKGIAPRGVKRWPNGATDTFLDVGVFEFTAANLSTELTKPNQTVVWDELQLGTRKHR